MIHAACHERHVSARTRILAVAIGVCVSSCATQKPAGSQDGIPVLVAGEFVDDYDMRYTIDERVWLQQPRSRFEVIEWHPGEQFLIARNGRENPSEPGLYSRIDWMELEGHAPYEWAFCYTTYDARSAGDALTATPPNRSTPRTGCNGYPFSRMRRAVTIDE